MTDKNLATQPNSVAQALAILTQSYTQAWQDAYQSFPVAGDLAVMPSPCLTTQQGEEPLADGAWQACPRTTPIQLEAVEKGIEIAIHSDIHEFYGSQYSADLSLSWQGKPFTLLQVWSDEDLVRLQENILGHLVTQKRLKLKPTVFIGALDSDLDVISICNLSGEVIHERLGTSQRDVLAPDVVNFLNQCDVEV